MGDGIFNAAAAAASSSAAVSSAAAAAAAAPLDPFENPDLVGPECCDVGVVECLAEAGTEVTTNVNRRHSVDLLQDLQLFVRFQIFF